MLNYKYAHLYEILFIVLCRRIVSVLRRKWGLTPRVLEWGRAGGRGAWGGLVRSTRSSPSPLLHLNESEALLSPLC